MREVGCGKMGEGCSDSRRPHPGTPEAQSESHDWHMGWTERERDSEKCQTLFTEILTDFKIGLYHAHKDKIHRCPSL